MRRLLVLFLCFGVVMRASADVTVCVENRGVSPAWCPSIAWGGSSSQLASVLYPGESACYGPLNDSWLNTHYYSTYRTNNQCGGALLFGTDGIATGGTLVLYITPGGLPYTNNCWVLTFRNMDPIPRTFDVGVGDCGSATRTNQATVTLQPGESATYTSCLTNEMPAIISACRRSIDGEGWDEEILPSLQQNQDPPGSYTNGPPKQVGGDPDSGVYSGGTTNINWVISTNDSQTGFSALYAAISALAQQENRNSGALQAAVSNGTVAVVGAVDRAGGAVTNRLAHVEDLLGDVVAGVRGLTNVVGQGGGGQGTNVTDFGPVTNLLTMIKEGQTNTARGVALSNQVAQLIMTNSGAHVTWAGAYGQARTALEAEGVESGMDGIIGQLEGLSVPEEGGVPDMKLEFCGHTIDLDPVVHFPSVFAASRIGGMVVVTIAFVFFAARLFWRVIAVHSSQQLGGVPNLEVSGMGFGSNLAGVGVAVVVPLVFVTAWTAIVGAVIVAVGDQLALGTWFTTWAGSLGEIGWYLLNQGFPVQYAITTFLVAVVLQFTAAKAVMVAQVCSRFLWGQ